MRLKINHISKLVIFTLCAAFNASAATYVVPDSNIILSYEINEDATGVIITGSNTEASGALTIPNIIDNLPVLEIHQSAFSSRTNITSVTVPKSITTIGGSAFRNCYALETVILPDILLTISSSTFSGCRSLQTITLPSHLENIGPWAFERCDLRSIVIPSNVVSIEHSAFQICQQLESVELPNSLETIGNRAFAQCSTLNEIVIPDSVTVLGESAFYLCTSLESAVLPNNLDRIQNFAFAESALASINIPAGTSTLGYGAFSECDELVSVYIPANVTRIESRAFFQCDSITTVTLEEGLEHIGNRAFHLNRSLSSVTIPSSVSYIGPSAFGSCLSLLSIDLAPNHQHFLNTDGVLFTITGETLHTYPAGLPSSNYTIPIGVTTIGTYAFSGCGSLEEVIIPGHVISIDSGAFTDCWSLNQLRIKYGVQRISSDAFSRCRSLKSITIPGSVYQIGSNAFAFTYGLKSAIFTGNKPEEFSSGVFQYASSSFKLYFFEGASDFTEPTWAGYDTVMLDREADSDGDRFSDWFELCLGTDPDDRGDVMQVTLEQTQSEQFQLQYEPHSDQFTYEVEWKHDLSLPQSWQVLEHLTFEGPPEQKATTLPNQNQQHSFYRVKITEIEESLPL